MIIHDCEQNSDEWYNLRAGLPTASEFSKLVTSKGVSSKQIETYGLTLAAEKYAGRAVDAWEGNQWTERGKDMEGDALALYAFTAGVELQRVGFVTDDASTMGCSPDALVGDDGLVETKCRKAEKHIETLAYFDRHRKSPPEFLLQAQGQMLICGREWCDLQFHHPVLPPLTIRIEADSTLHSAIREGVALVSRRRDEAFAMIQKYAGDLPANVAAKITAPSAPVDLSTEKPAF